MSRRFITSEEDRQRLLKVLFRYEGNIKLVAKVLGISTSTIIKNTTRFERWKAQGKPIPEIPADLAEVLSVLENDADQLKAAIEYFRGDEKKAAKVLQISPRGVSRILALG